MRGGDRSVDRLISLGRGRLISRVKRPFRELRRWILFEGAPFLKGICEKTGVSSGLILNGHIVAIIGESSDSRMMSGVARLTCVIGDIVFCICTGLRRQYWLCYWRV